MRNLDELSSELERRRALQAAAEAREIMHELKIESRQGTSLSVSEDFTSATAKPDLTDFRQISLEEMDKIKLLDRQDTKFIFHDKLLSDLLAALRTDFKVLTIDKRQLFRYENLYYDTEELLLYLQHHNEQRSRFKIRHRRYVDSGACFFEVKQKTNKQRTIKRRISVAEVTYPLDDAAGALVEEHVGLSRELFIPRLITSFTRMTLVSASSGDRVTIDFNLRARGDEREQLFPHLVIAEIKQSRYSPGSPFFPAVKELDIPEVRLSKYCLGILSTYPGVKYNRFKPILLTVNRIVSPAGEGVAIGNGS